MNEKNTQLAAVAAGGSSSLPQRAARFLRLDTPLGQRLAALLLVACGLWFPLRMVWVLSQYEEHIPSYDYCGYMAVLDRLAAGEQNWVRLPQDCCFNGGSHCMLVPTLIRFALTHLNRWDIQAEVWLAIAFAFGKVLLLTYMFARSPSHFLLRAAVFLFLCIFTFSSHQLPSYEFGAAGLNQHCADFAFLIGLATYCSRPNAFGYGALLTGGIAASWSYGAGLASWPAILAVLFAARQADWSRLALWGFGAAVAASPYIAYRMTETASPRSGFVFAPLLWLKSVGVVVNGSSQFGMVLGGLAVGACAIAAAWIILRRRPQGDSRIWACAALGTYAATMVWLIVYGRGVGYAPWYGVHFVLAWCTLLGLAAFLLDCGPAPVPARRRWETFLDRGAARTAVSAVCLAAVLMTFKTNSIERRSFFLHSRSHLASSYVRNYRTAPSHVLHQVLSAWRPDFEHLATTARILERRGWNVFGPHRIMHLQGDWPLDTVTIRGVSDAGPTATWTRGDGAEPLPYHRFETLDLLVPTPLTVEWTITLPAETTSARFLSAVAVAGDVPQDKAGFVAELRLVDAHGAMRTCRSQPVNGKNRAPVPIEFDLQPYAGQTITLVQAAEPRDENAGEGGAFDRLRWTAPRIVVDTQAVADISDQTLRPSNTDLSPAFVPPGEGDLRIDPSEPSRRRVTNAIPVPGSDTAWTIENSDARFEFDLPRPSSVREYPTFCFKVEAAAELKRRNVEVILHYRRDGADWTETFSMPLVPDAAPHWYSFDQAKLGLPPGTVLTRVALRPALHPLGPFPVARIGFQEMGLRRASPAGPALARKPDGSK